MRRLTANLVGQFARGDEIGVAERELSDMQRDLGSMLHQKSRLPALGLAVSKINHDLRNLLASSQLLSDQLASVPDPRVQRFAPKLMRSLERAIAFCQSTLSYGRAQEAPPDRRMILIEPILPQVRAPPHLPSPPSLPCTRPHTGRARGGRYHLGGGHLGGALRDRDPGAAGETVGRPQGAGGGVSSPSVIPGREPPGPALGRPDDRLRERTRNPNEIARD